MNDLPPDNFKAISIEDIDFKQSPPLIKKHRFSFGHCGVQVEERAPAVPERDTLFFLHGRLASGESWGPLIEQLPQFRSLSLDFPGFGESTGAGQNSLSLMEAVELCVQVVERFLPQEGKGILVGQDIGGVIALLCAIRCKAKVEGVVLLNSAHLLEDPGLRPGFWGWLWTWRMKKKFRSLLRTSSVRNPQLSGFLNRLWETGGERPGNRRSRIAAIRSILDSWPGPFERKFWAQEVRALSCPALLLWGARDELNPLSKGIELLKMLPHSDFYQDLCGHWPHLENPEWVAAKIREFLFRKANGRKRA
jgi:pimeloyl-ACP methyl ester carboxylesterase